MATVISGSPYISILDSKIIADLCGGNLVIDVTPSTFTAGGASYVEGASVKITSPIGVVIRDYITSGYDIEPPMTGSVSIPIPLVASNYLYGDYTVTVRLTDADGTHYYITKTVNICPPDKKNKTKKQGCLDATITGDCKNGKVVILLDEVPTYRGVLSSSQVNDLEVEYPTSSGLAPLETSMASFSVVLFEGVYKVTGTVCATYDYGDNVFYKVLYKVDCEKKIICKIDKACIQDKLDELNARYNSDCTDDEKAETASIILQTLFLLEAADNAAEIGNDPSEYITELEALLGCSCSCNCNEGTPYIDNTPATDYVFQGCGFENEVTGLTRTITINNYRYELVNASGSALVIGAPVVDAGNCIVTQTITFDTEELCNIVGDTFMATAGQKNAVDNTLYGFLISGDAGCQKIFAPTGFAVMGATRKSAFGKMEWYETLTLANAAAVAGETVLIYVNTAENLTTKNGVSYFGVGNPSIGNLIVANSDVTPVSVTIENINVTGTLAVSGTSLVKANINVYGDSDFRGTSKWMGGNFYDSANTLTMSEYATLSDIYCEQNIFMNQSSNLLNFNLNYTGVVTEALQVNSQVSGHKNVVMNGRIKTTGGTTAAYFINSETQGTYKDIIAETVSGTGVYIHSSNQTTNTRTVANSIIGISQSGVGLWAYAVKSIGDTTQSSNTQIIESCIGISESLDGIRTYNGSLKNCMGYSDTGFGINVGGAEQPGYNILIVNCVGESKGNVGLYCTKDVEIINGTFISRLNTALGNPIRIGNNNGRVGLFISGATTVATYTNLVTPAYAIGAIAPMTAKIMGCRFLNEFIVNGGGTFVPGIDPAITLLPVSIDAYNNIR